MCRAGFYVGLASAFLLLSLILTWPLVTRFTTHVLGSNLWAFDEYTFVWNSWWFQHALLQLNQSPLQTDFIFYPIGINFALYTFDWFNAALALPLLPWVTLPAAANLTNLFSFVLSAFGAYLLVRYLLAAPDGRRSQSPRTALSYEMGAICAAIAYGFTTSRFVYAAIGHYNMLSTEWLPFFALYLFRLWHVPSRKNAVMLGLFLALTLYAEPILAVFLMSFMLIFLVIQRPWQTMGWRGWLTRWAQAGAVAAFISAPVLWPAVSELRTGDYVLKGWGDAQRLSVDLVGLVSPASISSWAGLNWEAELTAVQQGQSRFADVNTGFVGIVTLVLAVSGWLAHRRAGRVWGAGALVSALFTLGPLLQINGKTVFDLDGLKVNVPLPFIILHYLPIVQANRVPNRFSALLVLCLAVLVGYAAWSVAEKAASAASSMGWRTRRWPSLIGGALLALLLVVEHLSVPMPLTDARVPAFYARLAEDHDDYAILQLPLGWRNSFGTLGAEDTRVQYYQTTHHKRLLNGNTSRNPPVKFDYFATMPIVSSLIQLEDYKPVSPAQRAADRAYAPEFIRFFNLRYVVVAPAVPGRHPYDDTRAAAMQYLLDVLPLEPVSDTGELVVYRVIQPPPHDDLFIDFGGTSENRPYRGDRWDRDEDVSGASANWATSLTARVFLPVSAVRDYRLTFAALPFLYPSGPPQTVGIVVNHRLQLPALTMAGAWTTYEVAVPSSALVAGLNVLDFQFAYVRSPRDVLERTAEMIASGSEFDSRPLAAAVDWIRWQPR
ncbi:MAG: hypothetical protein HYR71_08235 [Chloroflexi bacterium]|nr:hypothetical protein [Chloroflexota bacterium]